MEDTTSGSARLPESSDSSTEEAMESEEGFTTVRGRRLKRKLRRTSPRIMPSQPTRESGNIWKERPTTSGIPKPARTVPATVPLQNADEATWPSLPSIGSLQNHSEEGPAIRLPNKSDGVKVQGMLRQLMAVMRDVLSSLRTPSAKAALQIMDTLEPLLAAME
ncbi:hypothetical protein HPB52_022511 [Rhipicephalus sanguineus]|uniref:Uncharacterized protein n=1 Tax=Rhipicephalus sanguineus TaxID=34632 RepID=A0A9D4PXQ2_RHISA|nr:hypothetical protein HPB52_022511 [Rhipicephalus sanguineus]